MLTGGDGALRLVKIDYQAVTVQVECAGLIFLPIADFNLTAEGESRLFVVYPIHCAGAE
jgi:hypothetical protein